MPGGGQAAGARPGPEAPGPRSWPPPGILYLVYICIYCIYLIYFKIFDIKLVSNLYQILCQICIQFGIIHLICCMSLPGYLFQ